MRPRIAVLPLQDTEKNTLWINPLYFGGIEVNGGIPVLLPLSDNPDNWEAYVDSFDGFVFTGGQDVAPSLYHREKTPLCGYQAPQRDAQEIGMLKLLLERDKPVLGICRGIQTMNVAAGGTLHQHLPEDAPSPVVHAQQKPFHIPHHQVDILEGSLLYRSIGLTRLSVNSMHHQAVDDPAPGFTVSARAEDGLAEAIEHPDKRFFLGVQWHPEHLWQCYDSSRRLWAAFVDACK